MYRFLRIFSTSSDLHALPTLPVHHFIHILFFDYIQYLSQNTHLKLLLFKDHIYYLFICEGTEFKISILLLPFFKEVPEVQWQMCSLGEPGGWLSDILY